MFTILSGSLLSEYKWWNISTFTLWITVVDFSQQFRLSNCSQNCWIDWNSAVLCFKRLFHIRIWTFAQFVRPLLATILCVWEIWSGSNNCVYRCMYHTFHWLAKQKDYQNKQNCITAPILKLTYDQKPETFFQAAYAYSKQFCHPPSLPTMYFPLMKGKTLCLQNSHSGISNTTAPLPGLQNHPQGSFLRQQYLVFTPVTCLLSVCLSDVQINPWPSLKDCN